VERDLQRLGGRGWREVKGVCALTEQHLWLDIEWHQQNRRSRGQVLKCQNPSQAETVVKSRRAELVRLDLAKVHV
jgi:hypothetical protein